MLGTDGMYPRVSLREGKFKVADQFMAVRCTPEVEFYAAVLIPKSSARPLFEARKQVSGALAHIAWRDWISAVGAVDYTRRFADCLRGRDKD